jgi:hypothetical protein
MMDKEQFVQEVVNDFMNQSPPTNTSETNLLLNKLIADISTRVFIIASEKLKNDPVV